MEFSCNETETKEEEEGVSLGKLKMSFSPAPGWQMDSLRNLCILYILYN